MYDLEQGYYILEPDIPYPASAFEDNHITCSSLLYALRSVAFFIYRGLRAFIVAMKNIFVASFDCIFSCCAAVPEVARSLLSVLVLAIILLCCFLVYKLVAFFKNPFGL